MSPATLSTIEAESLRLQGLAAFADERMEEAVRALRQALVADPQLDLAWNDLGVVMEALGNPYEALSCYRRALCLDHTAAEPRENLDALLLDLDLVREVDRLGRAQAFTFSEL